ncbi:MAG: hypothetical protein GY941_01745 [Planctomycetes bacterium]|nr:hypothetical protein [Planctomycetota bacterium]
MKNNLTMKEKVAVLLLNLGAEAAGEVLQNFGESEIAEIGEIIGRMRNIDEDTSTMVMNEFVGQFDTWRDSEEIIDVIKDHRPNLMPFIYFKNLLTEEVVSIINGEHPQLISLVLSYLEPQQSAEVVSMLPEESRADIINRMATSSAPPIQIIKQIDELLEAKVISLGDRLDTPNERRYRTIAEILNKADSMTEKNIMQRIKEENPEIAKEIKTLMFVFGDVAFVEDKALRKVLSETNSSTIAMCLKTASNEVREKIFKNMSKRMGDGVLEEQELLGPKPLNEVEAAQKEIVDSLSKMEAEGETVRGNGGDSGPLV